MRTPLLFLSILAALGVACSSSSSNNGSGTGGGTGSTATVSSADCQKRCSSKLTTCGATTDQASQGCTQQVCTSTLTEGQLSCFEGKTCNDIQASSGMDSLCPKASGGGSDGGGGGGGGGGACGNATCSATQYCSLTLDSQGSWQPGSCKDIPSACADKSASEICTCMKTPLCPTSGTVSSRCSINNGAIQFGCTN